MNKNMTERINGYAKEYIFEQYTRIVPNFKSFDKISKEEMLNEIYKVYNYENIIDICTVRELKYLELILDKNNNINELLSDKYEWERETLNDKFLIESDLKEVFIPNEIIDNVKEALKNVDWDNAKKLDELNEVLVGYCKIQGSDLIYCLVDTISPVLHMKEDLIETHMYNNKLFNYYVHVYIKTNDYGQTFESVIYQDDRIIEEFLTEEKGKQGLASTIEIDKEVLKTIFYNDFDINNIKIKKFLDEIKKLPFFWKQSLKSVRMVALLNADRKLLKDPIKKLPSLKNYDLNEFFKIMDEAMDEMPSGALNGFSPNEAKRIKLESEEMRLKKAKSYTKQQNACLSKKDVDLFYKIYTALLEFTNDKYKIKNKFKIYKKTRLDIKELLEVIEFFWKNKDKIVTEFCTNNPYNFNQEELDITSDFKKGFRELMIIANFEEEYTGVIVKDRVYMIKGVNVNVDNIFSFQDLPVPVVTSIIPFKNVLIHDSILVSFDFKYSSDFITVADEDYNNSIKYYHI